MSRPKQITVGCQRCAHQQDFTAWESLNVTLDPTQKEALLSGKLSRFTCTKCAWSGNVVYPMLYHDMTQRLMIFFWPESGAPPTEGLPLDALGPGHRIRRVSSLNELLEKILIFDQQLDDRVIEVLKLLLQNQQAEASQPVFQQIFFATRRTGKDGDLLWFEHLKADAADRFALPIETYTEIETALKPKLATEQIVPGRWPRVDKAYAAFHLRK